jgi:hypothetical protein
MGVFGTSVLTKIDSSIDLSALDRGEPVYNALASSLAYMYEFAHAAPADTLSVRWSGFVRVTTASEYTFRVLTSPTPGIRDGLVPGSFIRVGTEIMRITHVFSNSLGHFTPATLTVVRGAADTVASTHDVQDHATYVLPLRDLPIAKGYVSSGGTTLVFGLQGTLPLDGYYRVYRIRVDGDGTAATAGDVGVAVITAYSASRSVTLNTALAAAPTSISTFEVRCYCVVCLVTVCV